MNSRLKLEIVEPIDNPCSACEGNGSEWPKRRDGKHDRRFKWPIGPCRKCGGSGRND